MNFAPKPIEIDIWRAAQQMIEIYGPDAGINAALRADHLLDQGDPDGFHVWKRIVDAIKQLQGNFPESEIQLH